MSRPVMIVEDDFDVRTLFAESLNEAGYEVETASNGLEALDLLRELRGDHDTRRPGVILLDLMMPIMDGWEFRRQQQDDPKLSSIPVVAITAAGDHRASTIAVSANAISAWPQTMPPFLHSRSENGMRRIAPGCQSAVSPGGGVKSSPSIDRLRSLTHGANTSPSTRFASPMPNSAVCGCCCMDAASSPDVVIRTF